MNIFAENLWHTVRGACTKGLTFLHEDASRPHEDGFGKRYNGMMRHMLRDSAEYEAENENGGGAALDDLIADLIASRH